MEPEGSTPAADTARSDTTTEGPWPGEARGVPEQPGKGGAGAHAASAAGMPESNLQGLAAGRAGWKQMITVAPDWVQRPMAAA
jgi:hypothetical protein